MSQSEEAAPEDLVPELLNEVSRVRNPEQVHLDEIDEAAETAQGLLNESFTFREQEQLTEEYGIQGAAQINPKLEQVVEGSQE